MPRRARHVPRLRRLCALIAGCVAIASLAEAAEPRHLQAPSVERAPGSPFDAALRDDPPPRQYESYRYLGRPGATVRSGVVFAEDGHSSEPNAVATDVFPQDDIRQTQYPFDVPPASQAPDEPGRLRTSPVEQPGWITANGFKLDATSVLGQGDDLGITSVVVRGVIESPRLRGFSLRPSFGTHVLAGPVTTDLPGQVYDLSLEARMYWPFGDRWLGEFALAPGFYTDFQNTSSDAFRMVGRAIGYYKWSEAFRVAVGAVYLDRRDVAALPAVGVVWTPTPDWRLDIMMPRPRVAHRLLSAGDRERWVYLQGEFGGGSWAVERANGTPDIATYRDYRLLCGIEFEDASGPSWRLEAGYAFGRELEYDSTLGDFEPSAAGIVGASISF